MTDFALADGVDFYPIDASVKLDPKSRVSLGQYMTPIQINRFVATLVSETCGDLRVLNGGTEMGSLTVAFVERVCTEDGSRTLSRIRLLRDRHGMASRTSPVRSAQVRRRTGTLCFPGNLAPEHSLF